MILGSHNSFSYLKPKHWWMYPFIPIARCQSKNIVCQFDAGARWFDLRIRYDNNGNLEVAHGLMAYKADAHDVCDALNKLSILSRRGKTKVYVRVFYELSSKDKSSKAEDNEIRFCHFCRFVQINFPNLIFIGGRRKYDWRMIFDFNTYEPRIVDKYSSMTWLRIDDWLPWLYAKIMNKRNWKKYKNTEPNTYMVVDFVHHINANTFYCPYI